MSNVKKLLAPQSPHLSRKTRSRPNTLSTAPFIPCIAIDIEVPSDTEAIIDLIRKEFPHNRQKFARIPPIILKTQLHALVSIPTSVDVELDELKRNQKIRLFKIPNFKDEYMLLKMDDYISCINSIRQKVEESQRDDVWAVFDKFINQVLPHENDVGISKARLEELLSGRVNLPQGGEDILFTEQVSNEIGKLIEVGLIVRNGEDRFYFCIPNAGTFLKHCQKGRIEMMKYLKRIKFRETFMKTLMKKKLQSSELGNQFHIRDLQGSGFVERVSTPSGEILRLR